MDIHQDKGHSRLHSRGLEDDPSERPQVVGAIQDEALRRGKEQQDWLCIRWRGGWGVEKDSQGEYSRDNLWTNVGRPTKVSGSFCEIMQ